MKPYGYMNVYADGRKEFHYGIDNASVSNIPLYTKPQQWHMVNKDGYVKPLSDEEIGDCVDDCFGLMALQHKYTYSIDQVQEYGLKLCKAIEERHGIK